MKIDSTLTEKAKKETKYINFKDWLLKNGAVFDDNIDFPVVFEGGLMGISAKKHITGNKAFILVPNNLIISAERARTEPELKKVIEKYPNLLSKKHPDCE